MCVTTKNEPHYMKHHTYYSNSNNTIQHTDTDNNQTRELKKYITKKIKKHSESLSEEIKDNILHKLSEDLNFTTSQYLSADITTEVAFDLENMITDEKKMEVQLTYTYTTIGNNFKLLNNKSSSIMYTPLRQEKLTIKFKDTIHLSSVFNLSSDVNLQELREAWKEEWEKSNMEEEIIVCHSSRPYLMLDEFYDEFAEEIIQEYKKWCEENPNLVVTNF